MKYSGYFFKLRPLQPAFSEKIEEMEKILEITHHVNDSSLVKPLQDALNELDNIAKEATSSPDDLTIVWDRFYRWKDRTIYLIRNIISDSEAVKFDKSGPISFSDDDELQNFINTVKYYNSHLQVFAKDIQDNPEFYTKNISSKESLSDATPLARLEKICGRFNRVARQIRERHGRRSTLEINDEYDVQDLIHALLKIEFDDIRPEEVTPSYAGGSARMDFLLKNEKVVLETKKTRLTLSEKQIGEELIVDIQRYKNHPECKTLVCFIYDPEGRVGNPAGLIADLEKQSGADLNIKVIINPMD